MDKIYLKDNYVVTELGGITAVFPKNYSSYSENASGFYINSTFPVNNQRTVFIDFTRVTSIYNEAGTVAYTIGTLRSYLLTNTGFKSPSGGSGGVWGSITGTLSDQTDLQTALNAKQNTLVSGTNIKTINSTSLLGSGDVAVQPTLVSGTNIKTINGNTLLGSGDLTISTGITVGTTAVTSGTNGRVFFQAGGVVQQDSAFFWDNTNKRLGIGATPSTSVRLDVRAQGALSTDIAFRVRNSADTFNQVEINGDGTLAFRKNATNESISIGNTFLQLNTQYSSLLMPLSAASTEVTINTSSQGFRVNSSTGRFWFNNSTYNGSLWMIRTVVGLGGMLSINDLAPVSAANALTILNGTPPATNFTDRHWYYSADIVAGNAAPHFRTENGNIIRLFRGAALTASDGTLANAVTRIAELEARLQAAGLIA